MRGEEKGEKVPVGVLGATGLVGQRFIHLLKEHPRYYVAVVAASTASAGKAYNQAVKWRHPGDPPSAVANLQVQECKVESFMGKVNWIFSALDTDTAVQVEPEFAKHFPVFSNASAYRMIHPLVVPSANPEDIQEARRQQSDGNKGFIITNSNCTVSGVAVVCAILQKHVGALKSLMVTTMQSVSGAGANPGLSFYDIDDNVIPFIRGEEEKMAEELRKILKAPELQMSVACNRVHVSEGHMVCLSLSYQNIGKQSKSELIELTRKALEKNGSICLLEECDRPQPKLDRHRDGGMAVSVGRLRECEVMDLKMVILINNLVLGAAGASLRNAELAEAQGLF